MKDHDKKIMEDALSALEEIDDIKKARAEEMGNVFQKASEDIARALGRSDTQETETEKPGTHTSKTPGKAETAEEFREKYSRKKFRANTAGKAVLYHQLYREYQRRENYKYIQNLYPDISVIFSKIQSYEDIHIYNLYTNLTAWVIAAHDTAERMRDALISEIDFLGQILDTVIATEHLRLRLSNDEEMDVDEMFSELPGAITAESYLPRGASRSFMDIRKENIESLFHYLLCYNTVIDMIIQRIKIPEFDIYKVSMETPNYHHINGMLSFIRQLLRDRPDQVDPEYIIELTEVFAPLPDEPDPIPAVNIKTAAEMLDNDILREYRNAWYTLINILL